MTEDENALAGRLIERLLVDPVFRGEFRRDPVGACVAAGLPGLAWELGGGVGSGMETLELRESRSSLAGVVMAAAVEGLSVAEAQAFVEHGAKGLHGLRVPGRLGHGVRVPSGVGKVQGLEHGWWGGCMRGSGEHEVGLRSVRRGVGRRRGSVGVGGVSGGVGGSVRRRRVSASAGRVRVRRRARRRVRVRRRVRRRRVRGVGCGVGSGRVGGVGLVGCGWVFGGWSGGVGGGSHGGGGRVGRVRRRWRRRLRRRVVLRRWCGWCGPGSGRCRGRMRRGRVGRRRVVGGWCGGVGAGRVLVVAGVAGAVVGAVVVWVRWGCRGCWRRRGCRRRRRRGRFWRRGVWIRGWCRCWIRCWRIIRWGWRMWCRRVRRCMCRRWTSCRWMGSRWVRIISRRGIW